MSNDVEFKGSIVVLTQGDKIILSLEGNEIELDMEEAAVLTYQLQLSLKAAAGQLIQQSVKQIVASRGSKEY